MVIHNLSDDGAHVFFETPEALSELDTDGINDIYEWTGSSVGGSTALISSGKSEEFPLPDGVPGFPPRANTILSITPDAKDVVFLTLDQLVPQAGGGGTPAIYTARVNGGFEQPPSPPDCGGLEGCRATPTPPPSVGNPTSEPPRGGNVRRPCRKARKARHRRNRTEQGEKRTKRKPCRRHKPAKR